MDLDADLKSELRQIDKKMIELPNLVNKV